MLIIYVYAFEFRALHFAGRVGRPGFSSGEFNIL